MPHISREDAHLLIVQLQSMAFLVENMPLVEFINEINRTDALAPILEPTWYRRVMGDLEDLDKLANGLLEFQKVSRNYMAKMEGRNE